MSNETPSWPPPPSNFGGQPTGPGMYGDGTPPRQGCLTAWLVLIIVANAFVIGIYSLGYAFIHKALPSFSPAIAGVFIVAGIVAIASALALFQWKRWGFYGIIGVTAVSFVLNLVTGVGIGRALGGLVGVAILYAVLNMGGMNSAWRHLK